MSQTRNEADAGLTYEEALVKASAYCAYQDRCLQDVQQKMADWQLPEEERYRLVEQLKAEQYLDELRYARSFVRGRFYRKGWGKVKIGYELQRKQLSQSDIGLAMQEIDSADYEQKLQELIVKKRDMLVGQSVALQNQKIMRYMHGKGYESDRVRDYLYQE